MKDKNVSLILLMVAVVLISVGLLLQLIPDKKLDSDEIKDNGNNDIVDKPSEDSDDDQILVNASYKCEKEPFSYTGLIDDKNVSFTSIRYYAFSIKDNDIVFAQTYIEYKFDSLTSFNNFKWNDKNSNIPMFDIKFDEEKLTKTYYWIITIPNKDDNKNINNYLKQLSNDGYSCTMITSN